jgi:transposase
VPTNAQAAIAAVFLAHAQRITELETQVRDLQARPGLNSSNSSKPPRPTRSAPSATGGAPERRKRGGQSGHDPAHRALVPPGKVRSTTDCKPIAYRRCHQELSGEDREPLIHQVAELPRLEPIAAECHLHRLTCPRCGETTCGTSPAGGLTGSFGTYLQAVLAMLAGPYRLSKRQIPQ